MAAAAACAVTLTGLPGLPVTDASAQITGGKRCDKKWLGKEIDGNGQIPGGSSQFSEIPAGAETAYDYANPNAAYDDLKAPTDAQKQKAGDTDADVKKWEAAFKKSGDPADKAMAIYARYNRQLSGSRPTTDWETWRDVKYIGNQVVNARGSKFEAKVVKDFNLVGPDWLCQVKVRVKDPATGKWVVRDFDAYNKATKEFAEFKSTGEHRPDQHRAERVILRDPKYRDHRLTYVTGMKTEDPTKEATRTLDEELKKERGTSRTQVRVREHRSIGQARIGKPNVYTKYDPILNPDPDKGGRGPINSAARASGPTPNDARRLQEAAREAGTRGAFPGGRGPGGVDFSTLELQYVGNLAKGKGIDYSFKADYMPNPDEEPGYGGQAKLQMSSDAVFTWLALSPDRMWVNLNPDQPDKIMDEAFGETDAGRVLLEADMEMKRDWSRALNPKESPGREFMAAVPKVDGVPCWGPGRNWIVPDRAQVREQDGGIYILDAPLKVDHAPMDFTTPVPGERCDKKLTEAEKEQGVRLMKQWIIPAVQEKVNNDPKYADLRRVYKARVAAEWIRQQDAERPTDFRKIINSNDLDRWPLRAPNEDWDKRTVWEEMRKSFTEGEYTYEWPSGGTVYTFTVGGVDFSKAEKRNITRARFDLQHPQRDETTKTSVRDETAYRDTTTSFMGGNSAGDLGSDPGPAPDPTGPPTGQPTTPAPDPTDPPTGQPTTPAPDPTTSTPAPGNAHRPQGPDGGLADTGSDTPVGLISAVAAALVAVGGALAWWMRRRRTAAG
ncbi:hypothetical protein ACFY3N_00615 [Streptomyces sp. NPDC000348]|uniref:hypothetical protein n=1 Tax=Streptomyces sp. NPDC000348 TaxID=3364538 RepID=UPI0036AFB60F